MRRLPGRFLAGLVEIEAQMRETLDLDLSPWAIRDTPF
jgi:hypothetical protein